MLSRLHHTPSRVLGRTHVYHEARLTFSSSAISFARRRLLGERSGLATDTREAQGIEDNVAENRHDADRRREGEELDRWLLAGEEKVNESDIRSYKDPYGHFCKNVASSFREPSPRNWLGRDVPFPLNPSFKPPIPLSDELRTRIYKAYMFNDRKPDSVRALANQHHLSIKRVEAILRLKGVEDLWKKNKPLQTGFTKGMEDLLGVTEVAKRMEHDSDDLLESTNIRSDHDRYDVEEADLHDEVEGDNKARQRYQRLFWESVAEGEEPVMPSVLGSQHGTALARTESQGKKTLVERAPGRPAIMFIDVGNAFVNEKEKERREREGARRSLVKARRRMRNHA